MDQARSLAWAAMNQPTHPGYTELQKLKAEKDGRSTRTRDTRQEILDLSFPKTKHETFPKVN